MRVRVDSNRRPIAPSASTSTSTSTSAAALAPAPAPASSPTAAPSAAPPSPAPSSFEPSTPVAPTPASATVSAAGPAPVSTSVPVATTTPAADTDCATTTSTTASASSTAPSVPAAASASASSSDVPLLPTPRSAPAPANTAQKDEAATEPLLPPPGPSSACAPALLAAPARAGKAPLPAPPARATARPPRPPVTPTTAAVSSPPLPAGDVSQSVNLRPRAAAPPARTVTAAAASSSESAASSAAAASVHTPLASSSSGAGPAAACSGAGPASAPLPAPPTSSQTSSASSQSPSPSTPAPAPSPPPDDERASDAGSSGGSTEAYNSEDEHPGGPSSAARAAAQPDIPVRTLREREAHFSHVLNARGLRIVDMRPDGNCLFRALAHVVWGDAERHTALRGRIMQYLVRERDYFSQFVAEDFARYVRRKSRDGTHGNHLELQAAAELFGRPIEVYSYGATPSTIVDPFATTAEPGAPTVEPIRLSFHRGSHYNAVEPLAGPPEKHPGKALASTQPAAADWRTATDSRVTEDEMERAVMALSLVEATRGESAAGSSSSASAAAMVPSVVLALVNLGYSEEQANDAYRAAGHAGLAAMVRHLTADRGRSRPPRSAAQSPRWDARQVAPPPGAGAPPPGAQAGSAGSAARAESKQIVTAPTQPGASRSREHEERAEGVSADGENL